MTLSDEAYEQLLAAVRAAPQPPREGDADYQRAFDAWGKEQAEEPGDD